VCDARAWCSFGYRRQGKRGFHSPVRAVLGQLGSANAEALSEIVSLCRDHPLRAVWPAVLGRGWVAVRPAGSRAPGPEVPLVWVFGETSADLAARMCVADSALTPPQLRPLIGWLVPLPPWRFRVLIIG
jgi:hypothetical protein